MLDYRMETFLTLCDQMNYRKTAEVLQMTQPAVTQHIQYLEQYYGQKLFDYTARRLQKTTAGELLEQYGRTAQYNQMAIMEKLQAPQRKRLRLGATKTIGDYVIGDMMARLLSRHDVEVSLLVDNTKHLLEKLRHTDLDIVLLEGYFDKTAYDYQLMRQEELVGICHKDHPFAGQIVDMEALGQETILLREEGSGTRAVFEQLLLSHNYTLQTFAKTAFISSFEVIKQLVRSRQGIAFVYQSVANSHPELATFQTTLGQVSHEFNYVYLKDTHGEDVVALLEK
ncbi:LysR substrate-binding domain-containing protein [Bengtsoniella intestinalis]|uniref:LysR substrate-binding domain-containing protein n=1 Tax=Bengtsoniella intestinalis TaxID=3073143 RepID=UPI00391FC360